MAQELKHGKNDFVGGSLGTFSNRDGFLDRFFENFLEVGCHAVAHDHVHCITVDHLQRCMHIFRLYHHNIKTSQYMMSNMFHVFLICLPSCQASSSNCSYIAAS